MAIEYKIVTIEQFADDAASEVSLNAEGANSWNLITATFQPEEATGKSTAVFTFKKNLSSSSSSSSSLSSSSSTSASSSSFSDYTFMGDGWPSPGGKIQVVIGDFWRFGGNVPFVEDEVITLIRMENTPVRSSFSEDGTTIPDDATNRILFMVVDGPGDVGLRAYLPQVPGGAAFTDAFAFDFNQSIYDLGDAIAANPTFTNYIDTKFFSTTLSSGTTFYYTDRIFKSIALV